MTRLSSMLPTPADDSAATGPRERHPVTASLVLAVGLFAVLGAAVLLLPWHGNLGHAATHLLAGIPLLLLLALALRWWPPPRSRAEGIARRVLLVGLAVLVAASIVEAVGAFGYVDGGYDPANALAELHNVGVTLSPVGLVLILVGTVLSVGVALTLRRSGGRVSQATTVATVVALAAALAFLAGGLIFGY